MNLIQRARLAGRIFFRGSKAVANIQPTWRQGQPQYPEVKFENLVKFGYRKNELAYACLEKMGKSAAQVNTKVMVDGERVDNHPLAELLERPNADMDGFDLMRAILIMQRLAGRAVFEKERSGAGRVVGLWMLRPDWVLPIPGNDELISHYEYQVPGLAPIMMDKENVLDFKVFDPLNRYQGWPPMAVLARIGDIDNAATDFIKKFFEEGGVPPGYLKTKQSVTPDDITEIRSNWAKRYGGGNWHIPAVLDQDLEYKKMGFDFREMGFDFMDERSEARICMVLGVPPILVGAAVGLKRATYSNYKEARLAWWEDDLLAVYKDLVDKFNTQLANEFSDGTKMEFDFTKVPALKESQSELWERYLEAYGKGVITHNQVLAGIGFDEIGPEGEQYATPFSSVLQPVKQPREMDDEDDDKAHFWDEETKTYLPRVSIKAEADIPDEDERREHERKMTRRLRKEFGGSKKRIVDAVAERLGLNGR